MIWIEANIKCRILRHLNDYPVLLILRFLDLVIVILMKEIGKFSQGSNMNYKIFFATINST